MPPALHCPTCRKSIDVSEAETWCVACGTPLGADITSLLPTVVAQRSAVALDLASAQPLTLSRGERVLRGMVGMGAVFGAVAGAVVGTLSAISFFSGIDTDDLDFLIVAPFAGAAIGFGLGLIYAGILALVARARSFQEVSIARVAAAGVVPGLVPAAVVFTADLITGSPLRDALEPLMIFPPLSAAVAIVTLLIARKAKLG